MNRVRVKLRVRFGVRVWFRIMDRVGISVRVKFRVRV